MNSGRPHDRHGAALSLRRTLDFQRTRITELEEQLNVLARHLEATSKEEEAVIEPAETAPPAAQETARNRDALEAELARLEQQLLRFATDLSILYRHERSVEREVELKEAQMAELLVEALRLRDPELDAHSRRVARLAGLIGTGLRLSEDRVRILRVGGLLHDIGKLALDPSGQNDAKRRLGHPVLGGRLIEGIKALAPVLPCVLWHHERLDGRGYPRGLKLLEIPLAARVVAAANLFDHLVQPPPPRPPVPHQLAVIELRRLAGTVVDERCVRILATAARRGLVDKVLDDES